MLVNILLMLTNESYCKVLPINFCQFISPILLILLLLLELLRWNLTKAEVRHWWAYK